MAVTVINHPAGRGSINGAGESFLVDSRITVGQAACVAVYGDAADDLRGLAVGIANGATANFILPPFSTALVALYKTDWQGQQVMYPTTRTNKVLSSDDMSNATYWGKASSGTGTTPVVTANYALGPDGVANAARVQMARGAGATASDYSYFYQVGTFTGVASAPEYLSFWAKSLAGTPTLNLQDGIGNAFNLDITLSTEWVRYTIPASGKVSERIYAVLRGNIPASSQTADFLLAKVQYEVGTAPTSYIPTTTAAVTVTDYSITGNTITFASQQNSTSGVQNFAVGNGATAAFTLPYTPVGTPSIYKTDWQGQQLHYSTARTNLMPGSQSIAGWTKSGAPTVTDNSAIAPDGTMTAETVDLTTSAVGDGVYNLLSVTSTAGQTITRSVWLKGASGGEQITFSDPAIGGGSVGTLSTEWTRFTYTGIGGASYGIWLRKQSGNVVYVWGAQVELGEAPTSYIPTTTTAVTVTDYTLAGTALTMASNPVAGAAIGWAGSWVGPPAPGAQITADITAVGETHDYIDSL